MRTFLRIGVCLLPAIVMTACSAKYYRKSADKEVYKIVADKQKVALGKTNAFTIDTPYSQRKPEDIKAPEIIDDRLEQSKRLLTLEEALGIAMDKGRQYQLRKEQLYLSALTLALERFEYVPQFFAGATVTGARNPVGGPALNVTGRAGLQQALKTGGRVGLSLANDLLRFYTGGRGDSTILTLSQPLLRGAGAKIAAENLTQAERDVIYEIRSFSYFEHTFAFGIVTEYLRLLQQQDRVKNEYANFLSRVSLRERAVALSVDRLASFQADLAAQEELTARDRYIAQVENYRTALDRFKILLGLPIGHDIRLDEKALGELEAIGLLPVPLTEAETIKLALERRPDLLNEIDQFEDSKRKIAVTANSLLPDLLVFGDSALVYDRESDYASFDVDDYRLSGGVQLDLPLNRKREQRAYRTSLIKPILDTTP